MTTTPSTLENVPISVHRQTKKETLYKFIFKSTSNKIQMFLFLLALFFFYQKARILYQVFRDLGLSEGQENQEGLLDGVGQKYSRRLVSN